MRVHIHAESPACLVTLNETMSCYGVVLLSTYHISCARWILPLFPPPSTDYIVVGGGTASLVATSRLSEIPTVQVLVLEAGLDKTSDPQLQNPGLWPTLCGSDLDWQFKTVRQSELSNREQNLPASKVLTSSSAINGAALLPPSPAGIDTWSRLGSSSFTLNYPPHEIHLSKGNHPLIQAWNKVFEENGYEFQSDLTLDKSTVGTRPYTATIDPESGVRSSADNQYRCLQEKNRPNLHIVTGATVDRVLFLSNDSISDEVLAPRVQVRLADGKVAEVKAMKEVILAAGGHPDPQAPRTLWDRQQSRTGRYGIPPIIDNPGVGENLQNHAMYVQPVRLKPQEGTITPGLVALAFVRTGEEADLAAKYLSPIGPAKVIRENIWGHPEEASANFCLSTRPTSNIALLGLIQCHPLSSGSTHISRGRGDPDSQPEIDPRFFSNPIATSPTLQRFLDGSAIKVPGDLEAAKALLRASTLTTHHHSVGWSIKI
ncbi:hypothetical protein BDV26DRAFT_300542 [Aspergillus bertholletiae]|uniref:glucose oxidase n=1 Tax=Aspergillus bertholletiae TaxID=1226010 RepID=A0A5N7AXN0_9EURO|nr:hypothetical protein BDV26DRAFT_300542 [Aspergillus bertholletiae]